MPDEGLQLRLCEAAQLGYKPCARKATSVTEFGDIYLCQGHRIVADANYEWQARKIEASKWLTENPT